MGFTIIHFSDIHFKEENNAIINKKAPLKRACLSELDEKNVVIVVSGDIAYSGKESEYRVAKSFFNELKEF